MSRPPKGSLSPASTNMMLSAAPVAAQQLQHYPQNHLFNYPHAHHAVPQQHPHHHVQPYYASPVYSPMPHRQPPGQPPYAGLGNSHTNGIRRQDAAVTQALEIARESPDGAVDPTICGILNKALDEIMARARAAPDRYVMSRDEFSLFNYFQHRFVDEKKLVVGLRKRYWDHAEF